MRYLQACLLTITAMLCVVAAVINQDPTFLIPAFLLGCGAGVYVSMAHGRI